VVEAGQEAGLAREALEELVVQAGEQLHGGRAAGPAVGRAKYGPHPARAGKALELEAIRDQGTHAHGAGS
jgi:hypothetical protein